MSSLSAPSISEKFTKFWTRITECQAYREQFFYQLPLAIKEPAALPAVHTATVECGAWHRQRMRSRWLRYHRIPISAWPGLCSHLTLTPCLARLSTVVSLSAVGRSHAYSFPSTHGPCSPHLSASPQCRCQTHCSHLSLEPKEQEGRGRCEFHHRKQTPNF